MTGESAVRFEATDPLPPIPGLRFRHVAGPSDYAGMTDAANDARIVNGDQFISRALMRRRSMPSASAA